MSSQFQALRSRPPSPSNKVQAVPLSCASRQTGAPTSSKSLAGSTTILLPIDNSQTVNESADQRQGQNKRSLAMFSDIDRLEISGNITQNINIRDDNVLKHLAFQLPRASDAAFNAAINLDNLARRPCTDGTRVDILAQITSWINEKNAPPVYWLTGLAGLGKTTIAYTICKSLDEARIPFASFFCSLQLDSKNSKLLVTTLCRDLAEIYNSYAANLLSTLETNSKAVHAGLRIQIDELLAKPWQAFIAQRKDDETPTPIIVVDALDESDRGTEFLEELLRFIETGQLRGIKFLVTSRPEPKIADTCKAFPPNAVCKLHEVDITNVQSDIEKYLREALPELKDDPRLAILSQRAGGFFIYATTAVRFIFPPHNPPAVSEMRSNLQAMLNPDPLISRGDSDERLLVDELYERILGDAFCNTRHRATRLRILHTIVCAEYKISIAILADLTKTEPDVVEKVVESLHAVLFVSPKDGNVYWYHASFPDFVFSQTRARFSIPLRHQSNPTYHVIDVSCDASVHHEVLARRCFSVMQESLHFNMCNLPSSYAFDSEVPGLDFSINKALSPTLRYVAKHWASHLLQAAPPKNETDELCCALKDFVYKKLLFWIEAMNLIGGKYECSLLLKDAGCWLEGVRLYATTRGRIVLMDLQGTKCSDLREELRDAANFSTFFAGSPASKSTPHLYISAVSMWNQDSAIWRHWSDRFGFIPSVSLPRGTITIPLLTIPMAGVVTAIALSPDGNQILIGSDDNSVVVWDANTGERLRELQGHTSEVTSVAFSPDGNRIVSASDDKSVRVWDAKTGEKLTLLEGHTRQVNCIAFSPDGNWLISGSHDKSVRVWDSKTGEQLKELQGHTSDVTSVAFSPDGNRIISSSFDKLQVWDANTGGQVMEAQGYTINIRSIAFSPDGRRIISGAFNNLRVWDAKTGEKLRELRHTSQVNSVACSPDGHRLVSGSKDQLQLWDAKTGEQLRELQGHTREVTSVAFSPDGNRIVSGSSDKSVRVWDAEPAEQLRDLQGHTRKVNSVAFSPDGNRIFSVSDDNSVCVWDAKTGEQLRRLQGNADSVNSVAISPDGNRIVSGSFESVWVWDAKTGKYLKELQGHTDWVNCVAFSPDGNRIVSCSFDKSVRVWDSKMGEHLRELYGHQSGVASVAFSPDGNRIVSASYDKSMRVWDAKTGKLLRELRGRATGVASVAFSPDGNRLVSGSYDKSVRVWDAKTGEQLTELQGHTRKVTSVAFSPDGNRIVSGSFDNSVRVWDAKTGEQLTELQGHTDRITSVAFSHDGNQIVSGSYDNSVRVWDNLNLDILWFINEDGWILSGAQRLAWVPSTISNLLLRPHNTLILSRNGSASISFSKCKLGTIWHECYTP